MEKTLSQYDLSAYISCVVAVEDVESKPAPDYYALAMDKLGKIPDECVAIEDTQTGMTAALAANLACVVILTDLSKHHDLSGATVRYTSLKDWVNGELVLANAVEVNYRLVVPLVTGGAKIDNVV